MVTFLGLLVIGVVVWLFVKNASVDKKRAASVEPAPIARRVVTLHPKRQTESVAHLQTARFSPDDRRVLTTASYDKSARLWDALSGAQILSFDAHDSYACGAEFSPDGSRIITTSASGNVARVWDAASGRAVRSLKTPENWVSDGRFSPDGTQILTVSCTWEGNEPTDNVVRVWDVAKGQEMAVLRGHSSTIESAVYSPDGSRIATASRDCTARIWNASTGTLIAILRHEDWVKSAVFSPGGEFVVSTGGDIKLWNSSGGEAVQIPGIGHYAEFSPDGSRFVVASNDRATTYDARSGNKIVELPLSRPGRENRCERASFSPCGEFVVLGCIGNDSRTSIWNASSGKKTGEFGAEGDQGDLTAAFNRTGTRILIAGRYNKYASIWELDPLAKSNCMSVESDSKGAGSRIGAVDASTQALNSSAGAGLPHSVTLPKERAAAEYFAKGELPPDSVLRCTIQTGDGDNADFLDGYVGAFRREKFLRFVMQNDERDDDGTYGWHSWDVPWTRLVEVILRERTSPQVLTDARQPDGTFACKGPYLQTRLYTMGRGIECRLLDADYREMDRGAPFKWLKSNVNDGDARFSEDTQEEPQYGDAPDCLDGYALDMQAREDRLTDEAASKDALSLSDKQTADLLAKRPSAVRDRYGSEDFAATLARRLSNARDKQKDITDDQITYTRRVISLVYAGAVPRRYAEMFYFVHFSKRPRASKEVKEQLKGVVRLMIQPVSHLEGS